MKKLITTLAVTTAAIGGFSIANAIPNMPMQPQGPMVKKAHKKPLNLTQEQAKTLVNAGLIEHGQADKKQIKKVDTIRLGKDQVFYLVYVGKKAQDNNTNFFVVNAQNGRIQVYPKPRFKHKRAMPRAAMGAYQPQPPVPVQPALAP
ncbi:hypothetical protein [Fangia hongkongensis]|uniref:hypothetical protein n=1 Tax=Fangia hongkongensis TaxID=270495 RepID=UPI00036DA876|nr:hypothetical protein [Fangia hongkongensis]MBK2126076.1 hypothetical protein [Fangia hongkongensis]